MDTNFNHHKPDDSDSQLAASSKKRANAFNLTFGLSKSQSVWDNKRSLTFNQLRALFAEAPVGPKNGPCYAAAWFSGVARRKDQATRIDVAVLDFDVGHTMEEIRDKVAAQGWRAIIHSTHSHMKDTTNVLATAFDEWKAKVPGQIGAFLVGVKGFLPSIAGGACIVGEAHEDGKLYHVVRHQPCPKFRVILPLAESWIATNYPSQSDANAVWRAGVTTLAETLGLSHDKSCVDVSRLFFLPRTRKGGPEYELEVLDGEDCDVLALPAVVALPSADPGAEPAGGLFAARASHVRMAGDAGEAPTFTPEGASEPFNLLRWVAGYGDRFEIAKALSARAPDAFSRRVTGVKRHIWCPRADAHASGDDGTGAYVVDASLRGAAEMPERKAGFIIHCSHDGCTGRDRLDLVKGLLEAGKLTVADLTDPAFLTPEVELDISGLAGGRAGATATAAAAPAEDKNACFKRINKLAMDNIGTWFPSCFEGATQDAAGAWHAVVSGEDGVVVSLRPGVMPVYAHQPLNLAQTYGDATCAAEALGFLCDKLGIEPASVGFKGEISRPMPEWMRTAHRDRDGHLRSNLFNVMLAMRGDAKLAELLAFDELQRAPMLMHAIPNCRQPWSGAPRPLEDADVSVLQEYLQSEGLESASSGVVLQAAMSRAMERPFHPVRDYLNSQDWDGVARLDTWLSTYLGAAPTEYTATIGRLFLISMVARAMKPGCKSDYMLVLEGRQGQGKSSACRILAGGDWFSDNMPDISGDAVRLSMHFRGKWLIEVAELHAMGKADVNHLKTVITVQVERYIQKYGRQEVNEPRQCVLIGTTNKSEYLQDETGGRRFWPVKIGEAPDAIKLDELARDRGQLFAEAVALYRQGAVWWPDQAFEAEHIAPQQEVRYEADVWEGAVADWLAQNQQHRVTLLEVLENACGKRRGDIGTADHRRVKKIMERLGWMSLGKGAKGVRYWARCASASGKVVDFPARVMPWA